MDIFWWEFFFFVTYIFAVLVCVSSVALFLWTVNKEGTLRTKWRALGFFLLGAACFLFILERKFGDLGFAALLLELFGLYFIYKGVLLETDLSHLQETQTDKPKDDSPLRKIIKVADYSYIYLLLILILIIFAQVIFQPFGKSVIALSSIFFILTTIRIQIKRYQSGSKEARIRRQNLWPLIGYLFLLLREITYVFYRLPELKVVELDQLTVDFGFTWFFGALFALGGFIFLGIWAWNFIKLRVFLRTYVVLSTLAIFVATSSCLINVLLAFKIIERNNLDLMAKGAKIQQALMDERGNSAQFVAKIIADNKEVIGAMSKGKKDFLRSKAEEYFKDSQVDIVKIYDLDKNIIASPSDTRDQDRKIEEDKMLEMAFVRKEEVISYDEKPGVLSPLVILRAFHPVINGDGMVGMVEVARVFDNAFVDFSKSYSGLDVTIYAKDLRSATTILTADGVSRWAGSRETHGEALKEVMEEKRDYSGVVDRLGTMYYSAFMPLLNEEREVVGMLAVGVPTEILLEDARQKLLNTFLIGSVISLLVAVLGYKILKRYSVTNIKQIVLSK